MADAACVLTTFMSQPPEHVFVFCCSAFVALGQCIGKQAISESPHLRRAAGAAATVVSAATNTARVQFTVTSRTLGKVRHNKRCLCV